MKTLLIFLYYLQLSTRQSSCLNVRGKVPAVYQVLPMLFCPGARGGEGVPKSFPGWGGGGFLSPGGYPGPILAGGSTPVLS